MPYVPTYLPKILIKFSKAFTILYLPPYTIDIEADKEYECDTLSYDKNKVSIRLCKIKDKNSSTLKYPFFVFDNQKLNDINFTATYYHKYVPRN